jgi:hypothetical protein
VIFNSFWSKITAGKFKRGWKKVLKGKKIVYLLNTVDRLDIFGGNGVYEGVPIVGHQSFLSKFKAKEVEAEIKRLIKMWRWKEKVSRQRLPSHKPGSAKAKNEIRWMNTCKRRADELESGFSLKLPDRVYKDRLTLNLGDLTLRLIYFGRAGFDGMTIVHVPEEKIAFVPGFIIHPHHLAPHPHGRYTKLDVPRWIKIFQELLKGNDPVTRVVVDYAPVWTVKNPLDHLNYWQTLWARTGELAAQGKSLAEVQKLCSMDTEFAFVKQIHVYKNYGDKWVRPQHKDHVTLFYWQHTGPPAGKKKK